MKSIQIKADSWHWKWLSRIQPKWAYRAETRGTDTCAYFWRLVWSIVPATLYAAVFTFCTGLLSYLVVGFVAWIFVPWDYIDVISQIMIVFLGIFSGVVAVVASIGLIVDNWYQIRRGIRRLFNKNGDEPVRTEPGALTQIYRSHKEKHCSRIEIV